MEPASRVDNGSAATIWLDSIAQLHAKRAGISLSTAVANGQGSHGSGAVAPAISSAEFEKMQKEQRALIIHQIQALAHHAGIDLREGSKARDAAVSASEKYQQRLDGLVHELGDDFLDGVAGIFEARKARVFDSSWNWARQALYEHIHSILTGAEGEQPPELSLARQHYLVNCASRPLLGHISGISAILQGSEDRRVQYAIELCASLSKACERALHQDPVYREFSFPTCPQTHIDAKGSTTYREALRSTEPSFAEYIEHMKAEENGQSPMLHLKAVQSSGRWEYCQKQTAEYFACLEDINTSGLSFSGKTALVTGCGKGSIGAQVLRRMLAGGAQVVATTSSYSRRTLQFFEDMYRECGAKGSQLVVVPFNQGSADDVTALVGYIYSKKGLGWDLDYAVPFAAISEVGSDISQITSRSELAHRIMLTNLVRLLGEIRQTKALLHLETRPTLAVLPLSPNHGVFGGDGLYGESKIALETLANRWRSESWADYLSIAGAAIGWTRGTGLMDGNNLVAEKIEVHGVRTFSTVEMAFNILGLMHDGICDLTQTAPVWADLNGGFDRIDDLKGAVTMARSEITSLGNKRKMVSTDSALDYYTIHGPGTARSPITLPASVLANHQVRFPKVRTTTQLAHLKYMEGMINLDKVVVVTGFGEVGPYGSSACRWEMEAYGEFSLEGCIELAWVMGYTKHFNGPMMATGKHYTGWVDCTTGEPVHNMDIKAKYEKRILEHTGIRFIEPELHNGYDPNRKTIMCELQIEHDMEPFEASSEAARQFKLKNGDRVDIWENAEGAWMVKFLKGAVIVVPKAMRFDRLVAAQIPSGWDPVRYGIQEDLVRQIDPITCYALVATVEALLRAGVTDPYELYQYFHVSEVGSTVGSGLGGCNSIQNVFHNRSLDKDMNSDVLQETFINVAAAWVNMLLLSSAGPVKPVVGACATSVLSIDVAVETIQSGKARVMLAGGIDDFAEDPSYEFAMMGATSNAVDEIANGRAPAEMSRPCTTTRNGFMEGEGAGIALLMSASAAIEAGAPIYGIIAMAGTATDKQGRSVPAPGKGVLVSARERLATSRSRLLDMGYRRRQLKRRRLEIDNWVAEEMAIAEEDADAIQAEADAQRKEAMDTWGNSFWCRNPQISPLRGSLAVWGLTVDDIGAASFHGTSTKANDKNESALINTQLKHLGRTPGHAVPAVCQKWLTGHPKGAAAAWMLNGALQILDTGIIPGNRNADNISSELEDYDLIFYPNKSVKTSGVKAVLLKSFGFGQVGGEVLAVHPDYLLAALPDAELSAYQAKVQQRAQQATRYWQDVL
ncbi:fatty acid synthase alpha subunit Lsd1, partial [Linderina pennispora]